MQSPLKKKNTLLFSSNPPLKVEVLSSPPYFWKFGRRFNHPQQKGDGVHTVSWQEWFRYSKIVMGMYEAWSSELEKQKTLMKVVEFWKDLCQKLCNFLNRAVFDSPTRKHRRSELLQDNLMHHGGVHPK